VRDPDNVEIKRWAWLKGKIRKNTLVFEMEGNGINRLVLISPAHYKGVNENFVEETGKNIPELKYGNPKDIGDTPEFDDVGFSHKLETKKKKFKDLSNHNISAAALTATYRLAYPFRQSTLLKLNEDIEETVSRLSLALQVLQVLQQKNIGSVQDDIEDAKSLLELVRADQVSSAIRHWLKAPDASVEYNSACKKRHPGTGLWLVKGSSFSSWLETPNSFLWLNGFAGCGKSVLCSTAIQYAFRHRRSSPRIGIAFFFFVFDDESKQDASARLRALVLQLSSQLKDNHGLLSRLHDGYRNTTPPDHALADCLRQLIRMFDHVYILFDVGVLPLLYFVVCNYLRVPRLRLMICQSFRHI
jgi:hypothetical protein